MTVPDVPGVQVPDGMQLDFLREHVMNLCQLRHTRFPGAQPVSFSQQSIETLKKEDYWVCEKSDGQRVLVLIVVPPMTMVQEVYLIDRKNNYYRIYDLFFPHHDPNSPEAQQTGGQRNHTLLDGELVVDRIGPQQTKLRLLLFDCIVLEHVSMADRPLSRRYGRLLDFVFPPYAKYLEHNKSAATLAPFEVMVKPMDLAYGVESVIRDKFPTLQHDNDGLIFTCLNSGYVHGSDPHILKWKPPRENTIDFKLSVRFPPGQDGSYDPCGKPFFELCEHVRGDQHQYFDWFEMPSNEWEKWKQSGEQLDDRIVECAWYPPSPDHEDEPTWHVSRIRNDKSYANHHSTVASVIQSIQDGVEIDQLIRAAPEIRAAWKERQKASQQPRPPAARAPVTNGKRTGPGPPLARGGMSGLVRR